MLACAARDLAPPVEKSSGRIRFSAWYSTNRVEIPLQGVVRLQRDIRSGTAADRLERLGLVMSQGTTVGVTVWDAEGGVQRKPGTVPGASGLLKATETCAVALLRLRGIVVPGKGTAELAGLPDTTDLPDMAGTPPTSAGFPAEPVGAPDAVGPLELRCRHEAYRVTVRITEESR